MRDQRKTKAQLIDEVAVLRERVAELERRPGAIGSTEAHYRTLVDSLDVSVCRWRPDTTLTFANDKYRRIFGIQGEAVGQRWLDFLPVETRAETAAFYAQVTAQPRTVTYEHPVMVDEGKVRQYQWIDTPILDGQGQVAEFQSVGLDITDRKQAEAVLSESEARFRGLLNATPDAMVVINPVGTILIANDQTEKMFGYSQAELIGCAVENLLPGRLQGQHIQNRARFMSDPGLAMVGGERDVSARRKTGEEFPVEISLSHHRLVGGEAVILSSIRDVTERKRTQELIATQRDLARLTGTALAAGELWPICFQAALRVSGLDSGGLYVFDEAACAFKLVYHQGLSADFVTLVQRFGADSPSAQTALAGNTIYRDVAEMQAPPAYAREGLRSGAIIPIQHHEQVLGCINVASHTLDSVPDYARSALETVASEIANVIIHQHTEEALRASREQLSQALLAARMGTWRYDLVTDRITWSPEAALIFGLDYGQADFKQVLNNLLPDDRQRLASAFQTALAQKHLLNLEYRILDACGQIVWITNYGTIEYSADGQPQAISGLIQDITARKNAEQALSDSEELYRLTLNNISDAVLITDAAGQFTFVCPNVDILFGYTQAEVEALGHVTRLLGEVPFEPAELERLGEIPNIEHVIVDKAGREHALLVTVKRIAIKQGRLLYTCHDISERKQAEESLRESEERYRQLVEQSPDAILVICDHQIAYINSAGVRLAGAHSAHDLIGQVAQNFVLPARRQALTTLVWDTSARYEALPLFEEVFLRLDGARADVEVTSIQTTYRGQPALQLIIRDITARKQAEEDLRLVEQRYRAMIENAPDGIVLIEVNGKFKYASPSVERIFGYGQADWSDCDSLTMTHPEDRPVVLAALTRLIADPAYIPTVQYRFRHKTGEWRWIESTFSNLLTRPNVAAIIINFRDIHERKLAEDDLKKSQDLLKEAQRIGRIGYMEWNGQARELICSDEIYAIFGLPPGSAISQEVIAALMLPAERDRLDRLDRQAIQQHHDMNYEYTIQTRTGQERWLHQIGKMTYGEDGHPIRTMIIVQDITERKQAESDLRASEENYRGLMESLDSVVAAVDADGFFRYMNDLGAARLGGTAADLIGRNMRDVFPEPLASQQLAGIRQVFQFDRAANFEVQSMDADHTLRWYRFSLQPLHDDRGQVVQVLINATDIHDLKTAQQDLQELNRTLEARVRERTAQVQDLYDNAPTGYHSLDADGRFVAINQTELNWLGYTPDQILGQPFSEFVTEQTVSQFQLTFPALKQTGKIVNVEFDMKRQDGSSFPVLINAIAILDEQGNYVRSRSTMTDITERKRAEIELKRNVNFTSALLEAIPTPVFYKDKAGCYQGCNHAFSDMMGMTSAQVQGKTVYELWPGDHAVIYHQRDLELMQSCAQQVYEATVIDKQGLAHPVIFVKNVFYDESSHVAGLVGAFVDITERKQAEEALHERERHSQSLLRLSRQLEQAQTYSAVLTAAREEVQTVIGYQSLWAYLLTDDQQSARLLTASGLAEEKLRGVTMLAIRDDPMLEEIVSARDIVVIEDARTDPRTNKALVDLMGNRTIVNVPIALFDRNLGAIGVGTFGDEGVRVPTASDRDYLVALASHMAVTFDRIHLFNERQRAEEELQIANAELQRALRVKDEFLASMSHELRTPLNAVLGLSESLIEQFIGSLNERQLRAMQTIESSGRHLLELINDILDLSKLEANQVALDLASVNVDDVCAASFMFIKDIAYQKYIQITSTLDPAVKYLLADERRLKQMLVNLLSNAVKFTPAGGVVKLQVVGHAADQTVSFAVSDTGIGIAPENIARLFQPFVQLNGGLNRQYEGTGLGLSLVARMAKLHGGRVTVESEPGQGSCFTLVLPWKRPAPSPVGAADVSDDSASVDVSEPLGPAPLILVVEDNEPNVITLSTYLQATGYRIAIARNGQEALDQARLKHPAIILMDLQMPVLDGLEAIRRLRRDSDRQVADTPVIALTALAMPADRSRSLEAGANEYVSKPVNLKRLTEVINRLVGEKSSLCPPKS